MSVLDLPLERQKEIAAVEGLDHAAWVKDVQETLDGAKAFMDDKNRPEWNPTPEEAARWQAKVDSGNPVSK